MDLKKSIVLLCCLFCTVIFAQTAPSKIFWKEDFSAGKLPEGWYIPKVGNWDPQWVVTDQPYPGSYKYQQQAPPIASLSRGFHLQFQAGYFTDEDVDSWAKKKQYPDGYVISAPVNCSGKQSVILKFQQKFRWWNYKQNDTAGLFVGISTDSIHWQQWDVRHAVQSETDMFAPLNEEINISQWAASQPKIFIRFYWKGLMGFYWMIDDITLSEAFQHDVSIVGLTSHNEENNLFKTADQLSIKIKNVGEQTVDKDFTVTNNIDSKNQQQVNVTASTNPLKPGEERDVVFAATDLSGLPTHNISFKINYPADEDTSNNSLAVKLNAGATSLGDVTDIEKGNTSFIFSSGISKVKVEFYHDDIFRIWLAPDGNFTEPCRQ